MEPHILSNSSLLLADAIVEQKSDFGTPLPRQIYKVKAKFEIVL